MKLGKSEGRKTKRDKKAKAKYGKYKKGGRFRSTKIQEEKNND